MIFLEKNKEDYPAWNMIFVLDSPSVHTFCLHRFAIVFAWRKFCNCILLSNDFLALIIFFQLFHLLYIFALSINGLIFVFLIKNSGFLAWSKFCDPDIYRTIFILYNNNIHQAVVMRSSRHCVTEVLLWVTSMAINI